LCSLKEAGDQAWFSPNPLHGVAQCTPQMRDVEAAQIAPFDPFELLPDPLARIEFGA
jgi:hypothetical protein